MADRLGPEYVIAIRGALKYLHDEIAHLIEAEGNKYAAGSQAANEHSIYAEPDAVFNAMALAGQLIESADDHLSVISKILVEPIEIIASWTCIRSMLESCALAAWLLDPSIDVRTRVGRGFALRYEGMEQEQKLCRAMKRPETEIDKSKANMDEMERDALALGFAAVTDKNGDRIGVGQRMLGATDVIKLMLDDEVMYRLLSAVEHGHHWAIRQLCYEESTADDEEIGGTQTRAFKKKISVDKVAVLTSCGVQAFLRALWNQCHYFGWNCLHFEEVFENVADKMLLPIPTRFWRS